MKIIIYSRTQNEVNNINQILQTIPLTLEITQHIKFKSFLEDFNKTTYDFIILDLDTIKDHKIKKILDFIQTINNRQKTIVLSNKYDCYQIYGCTHCKNNYQNTLLTKPTTYQDLVYALSDVYFCDKIKNKPLLKKIKDIEQKVNNFEFDIASRTFINKNSFLNQREKSTHEIVSLLNKKNIIFDIDKLNNILIIGCK